LEQFLDRGWLLTARAVAGFKGAKYFVQSVEQDAAQVGELLSCTLAHADKIVDKNVEAA
jgi:hypothetical protein